MPSEHYGRNLLFHFYCSDGILYDKAYLRSPTGKTVRPKDSMMTYAAAK